MGDRVVSDNTGKYAVSAMPAARRIIFPARKGWVLGYGMDGGFAQYVRIPGDTLKVFPNSLMRIPEGISFEEAAILDPCCNAYMAVVQESRFMPGIMPRCSAWARWGSSLSRRCAQPEQPRSLRLVFPETEAGLSSPDRAARQTSWWRTK